MSDYPKGGDIQTTRVWLDKKDFTGMFSGWKADAILGKSDEFIKTKFPQSTEGQDKAEILCGILNTARTSQNKNRGYSTASLANSKASSSRKRRWDDLNIILYNVVSKSRKVDKSSTLYASIEWCHVEDIFGLNSWTLAPKSIEEEIVNKLHLQLLDCGDVFGTISSGKETKRLHFIAPVLTAVALLFKDEAEKVKILVEEDVYGVNIRCNGHFEFVLQKGTRKVCIVVATQEDMEKGMAQSLLGCEAIADVENASVVYAVVTNFLQWYFLKDTDAHVFRNATTLATSDDIPTKESVARIAGMLYAMLTEV
eukprot:gene11488-13354_t